MHLQDRAAEPCFNDRKWVIDKATANESVDDAIKVMNNALLGEFIDRVRSFCKSTVAKWKPGRWPAGRPLRCGDDNAYSWEKLIKKRVCVRYLLAGLLFFLIGAPSIKAANYSDQLLAPNYAETAEELAKCSGFWEALADFYADDREHSSELLRGLARGADVAAAFLFSVDNNGQGAQQWAEGVAGSEALYWRAALFEMLVSVEDINLRLEQCQTLGEVQKLVIDEMRRRSATLPK